MTDGFIRNQWYVAANADEVGDKPLGRVLCGEPVVLYRKRDGAIAALLDRCPHRKLPLSLGTVRGDEIQCGYHGVRLNAEGVCTAIPSQSGPVPKGFGVRTFPVVERHKLIFVWIGDATRADARLIPDWSVNDKPGWTTVFGYQHVAANHLLILDNLLDLTHLPFVHGAVLGGDGYAENALEVEIESDAVRLRRPMPDVAQSPLIVLTRKFAGQGNVDRAQTSSFKAPGYVFIGLWVGPLGKPDELAILYAVVNSVTPESERSSHYFWSVARSAALDDARVSAEFHRLTVAAFDQDRIVLEAQQRAIDRDASGAPLVNFRDDRAGVAARRIIARLLAEQEKMPRVA
ncbi:MAG TPA: aromatic ring-hydroxylating dioxygenase subunit alpha [Stellaceae bacterium]|nr:aromatic ring-hydroxylating dioxygenase subunit alpha [Stellaceae bacterium]